MKEMLLITGVFDRLSGGSSKEEKQKQNIQLKTIRNY